MKRTPPALAILALLALVGISGAWPLAAATFTVTNTNDSGPGSLRQAILAANANPGSTVAFSIGSGVRTIRPLSTLELTSGTIADGTTQPGYSGTPLIEIDGSLLPALSVCVFMGTATVKALVVNRCAYRGIEMRDGATVVGCYVGTDPTGEIARGNGSGITAILRGVKIGGTAPGEGNLVSGNGYGIYFAGQGSVVGNRIGTNASGTAAVPNLDGIFVNYTSTGNVTIGGTTPGAGNLISGNNQYGIELFYSNDVVVQGNSIGPDASGGGSLSNQRAGVVIYQSSRNTIGGPGRAANTIAHNRGAGIGIQPTSVRNRISRNSIFSNSGLGIDLDYLVNPVVTPNDPCDGDSGPNLLQNFPVIAWATVSGGTITIRGSLDGEPSSDFDLEFFSSPTANVSGYGEGKTYLGALRVRTDGSCNASFLGTFVADVPVGHVVTATATDSLGDTSEFAQAVAVTASPVSVASIAPDSGPAAGSVSVTIAGTNFQNGASVSVGGVDATEVVVSSDTQITATVPPLPAGLVHAVVVTNTDFSTGGLANGWFADFLDVPAIHPLHDFVEKIFRLGITSGCGGGNYCPDASVSRDQMAVFLLRGKHGSSYVPPPATGMVFNDVPVTAFAAAFIEQLFTEGITSGCSVSPPLYCPGSPVTRAQMAVFLLRAKLGSGYVPPAATGIFGDVPPSDPFAPWIEDLFTRGITAGCGGGNYCPNDPNTRGQMAVFLTRTFNLP